MFAIVVALVSVLVAFVFAILAIRRMYKYNAHNCPVLLASPIRGSDFSPLPSMVDTPLYPMIDRVVLNNKGLALPYQGNELALLSSPLPLPLLNNQVQFTLNFWMRVENFDGQSNSTMTGQNPSTNDTSRFATLFAMNTGNTSRGGQFSVKYNSARNELVVSIAVIPPSVKDATIASESMQVFRIPGMLKLQKWQMITVVVDTRNVDVYHNSLLHRSYTLPNIPYLNNTSGNIWKRPNWLLYPGSVPFGGTISCARYFNYAFNVHEAYRLYKWETPNNNMDAPEASYLLWWTWRRGDTLTSLYRSLMSDLHM